MNDAEKKYKNDAEKRHKTLLKLEEKEYLERMNAAKKPETIKHETVIEYVEYEIEKRKLEMAENDGDEMCLRRCEKNIKFLVRMLMNDLRSRKHAQRRMVIFSAAAEARKRLGGYAENSSTIK